MLCWKMDETLMGEAEPDFDVAYDPELEDDDTFDDGDLGFELARERKLFGGD